MPDTPLIVWTTLPSQEQAEMLARTLVEESLAACVQIIPGVHSFYIWQGSLNRDQEWLVAIKSRQHCYPALEARLRALHPYEIPEILATPVSQGLPAYVAWLVDNTTPPPTQTQE